MREVPLEVQVMADGGARLSELRKHAPAQRALLRGLRDAARASAAPCRRRASAQRRARKIKPQYAEGELVKVARAANQPEAEFIEGLLLEEGIPSMLRRSSGFDVRRIARGRAA